MGLPILGELVAHILTTQPRQLWRTACGPRLVKTVGPNLSSAVQMVMSPWSCLVMGCPAFQSKSLHVCWFTEMYVPLPGQAGPAPWLGPPVQNQNSFELSENYSSN